MKQFLKLTIALILGVVALGFQSCGSDDDEPDAPLSLSQKSISLKKGETKSISIKGGTGDYSVIEDDDFYIFASARDNALDIMGRHVGTTTVTIKSGSCVEKVMVDVETEYPAVNIPILNWGCALNDIANKVKVDEQGDNYLGYKYIKVKGIAPVWSDETYYFSDNKLIAVQSEVREVYKSNGTPIMIMGERFKATSKSYRGYNYYDWFEKPNETRVRLCTMKYGNDYTMEVWYSTSDEIIETLSKAY